MVNKLVKKHECPIDNYIFDFINNHLHVYHQLGFTPNMVTTMSIIFGVLSAQQILNGNYFVSALLMLFAYYFDCVDGKLARKYNMISKFGDYYDHFGDLFKVVAIVYALFKTSGAKLTGRQKMFIYIIIILTLLQIIHFGYQERVYDNDQESPFLSIFKKLTHFDLSPKDTIQYTRYFGCGTWMVCFALIIYFWNS